MIARGESLTALALIGLPLAVVGGLMASIERAPKEEVFDLPSGPPPSTAATRAAGASASVRRTITPGPPGERRRTRATAGAGWALASAVIFSAAVLLVAEATALRPVALAAWGRLGTVALLVPVAMLLGGLRLPRPLVVRSAYAGVFDAAAFVALAAAIAIGPVAVASVVVSQVGTMAAVLGLIVLRERLSPVQYAGVALTGVAVAMLSMA